MTNETPDNLADAKSRARRAAFARRKAAKSPEHDSRAAGVLEQELGAFAGRIIAGYMPIRTEVDPLPAMAALSRHSEICVPVITGPGKPLVFHKWTPDTVLVPGPFGAAVPSDGVELVPEVLIVPLVAFTDSGARLGYGGGFYDRTLEQLRAGGDVRAIGFAFEAQLAETLPQEPTDQPLDVIVTDQGVRHLR